MKYLNGLQTIIKSKFLRAYIIRVLKLFLNGLVNRGEERMISILENKQFIEGIFLTKKEAENYFSVHPNKKNCRLVELAFDCFPFYILETANGFVYTCNQEEVIKFANEVEMQAFDADTIVFNLYRITEPFKSKYMDKDSMGGLVHFHLTKQIIENNNKTGDWDQHYFGQFDNVMRFLSRHLQQKDLDRLTKKEIINILNLCELLEWVPTENISEVYKIGDFTEKELPTIELVEKDEAGENPILFTNWTLPPKKRKGISLTEADWIIKID